MNLACATEEFWAHASLHSGPVAGHRPRISTRDAL
jgi:hypothetical protein